MPTVSTFLALGKDERSLARLTEHLPYAFVPVTTPAALLAQGALSGAFCLVDDTAPAALTQALEGVQQVLWLTANGRSAHGRALQKPVRLAELAQAVAHMLSGGAQALVLSPLCRFAPAQRLLQGEKHVALTEREADLLTYLAKRRGALVGREALFSNIWGFSAELDTHTLETHIYRLRGKLAEAGENPGLIETMDGGYRLA